ncbi:MAG TPA: glycosyltransferase family 4 protein [Ilumatobacteraceae bacterium]|nr:glycosyltransferase family 4 protein [Ilumatobacteraceae bacterium]
MRVLMLSWDFPPRATGGIAAQVSGLSAALAAAGHDVVVLTVADRPAELAAVAPANVRVLRAQTDLPWLPPVEVVTRIASANHSVTRLGVRLTGELDGWEPDVVHGHDWQLGWAADTLATRYGVPFVLTMHGTERVRHGGQLPLGHPTDINSIEWWLAFQAHRLIAPTKFIVEQLITGFELDAEHVVHIPNGIDPALWRPMGAGVALEREREPLVVSWGRVQYEKGFQVLARAMHALRGRVPEVHSVIAGRGSYLPELQTQVDVEGVSDLITLTGFVPDAELRRLLHRAGCVVIPSLYEPFGIVALEALAAGAPLIVARTGGLAELVVGTHAGVTFEPGNPDDLADAIEQVLTNDELATILVANARDLVERKYAWGAIARATADAYGAALAVAR